MSEPAKRKSQSRIVIGFLLGVGCLILGADVSTSKSCAFGQMVLMFEIIESICDLTSPLIAGVSICAIGIWICVFNLTNWSKKAAGSE